MSNDTTSIPRDSSGRFLSRRCPDPNCGGTMQFAQCGWWRCDGLTYRTDTGPLIACEELIAPPYFERDPGRLS